MQPASADRIGRTDPRFRPAPRPVRLRMPEPRRRTSGPDLPARVGVVGPDARKTKENRLAGPQPPAVTGSSLPGPLHGPSHRRARQGVARARARRYPQPTPVRPAADAVPREADAALRRPDADLDGAPVERGHVGVEGGRQPLGRGRPTPEALRPPPGRPVPSRCRGLDLRDDRRFARDIRPPGGRRPLRPGRRGRERPRSRPSPESGTEVARPSQGTDAPPRKKPRAGGQRPTVPGYVGRGPAISDPAADADRVLCRRPPSGDESAPAVLPS
jgi:hypothetical protein